MELELLDTPRTWFRWNESEHTVKDAPADVFDGWIRQYVDTIVNVDTAIWEIFQRWNIINVLIDEQYLVLRGRKDGSQILEEKASEVEVHVEEKTSELRTESVV